MHLISTRTVRRIPLINTSRLPQHYYQRWLGSEFSSWVRFCSTHTASVWLDIYHQQNGFHDARLTSRTSSTPAISLLRLARTFRVSIIAFTALDTRETYWSTHLHWYKCDQWEKQTIRTSSPVAKWLQASCVSAWIFSSSNFEIRTKGEEVPHRKQGGEDANLNRATYIPIQDLVGTTIFCSLPIKADRGITW